MREMKDSGMPWVGKIPVTWDLVPLRYAFAERKNKNSALNERNLLTLSYGKIKRKDIESKDGLLPASFEGYNIIEAGDIVLRLIDLQNDTHSLRTGLVSERGIITSAYITIYPLINVNTTYQHYLLHAYDVVKTFYSMGEGVRQGLNFDDLSRTIFILMPPLSEQDTIASFLNARCAKIDEAIFRLKQIIEKLEEYRKSVITQAVTKGLNPDVEMKDSGIPCVGYIPATWGTARIKQLVKGLTDGTHGTYERVLAGRPLLSAKNVFPDGLHISDTESLISEEDFTSITSNGFPARGDVLLCCVGTIGRCMVYDFDEPIAFQRSVIFLRPNERITSRFLYYAMSSDSTVCQESIYINQAAQAGLYQGAVREISLAFPSLSEQSSITDYLDSCCDKIREAVSRHKQSITKLEEYRKSIIYNAVTGKIDCRTVEQEVLI